jgi:hypothetical protein
MIDEVFSRPLPVKKKFESRFSPEGFMMNVFYSSERKETTLYEYGYHLLRDITIIGIPVYASTYTLKLITNPLNIIDVSTHQDVISIMSKTSYTHSHMFMNTIINNLDTIKYPNAREPINGGINYAIFKKESIADLSKSADVLIFKALTADEIDVTDLGSGTTRSIRPVKM